MSKAVKSVEVPKPVVASKPVEAPKSAKVSQPAKPVLFKNFNKDVTDLMTKNYLQTWKLECKLKPDDKTVMLNPVADNKGVGVNVEWQDKALGFKSKVLVKEDLSVKPTLTYEKDGHKVELVASELTKSAAGEFLYEGIVAGAGINVKAYKRVIDAGVSYPVICDLLAGAGATFNVESKKIENWTASLRYNLAKYKATVFASTSKLESFSCSVLSPLPLEIRSKAVQGAITMDYAKGEAFNQVVVGVAADTSCPMCPVASLKLRANTKKEIAAQYSVAAGQWKVHISAQILNGKFDSPKFGLLLVRE